MSQRPLLFLFVLAMAVGCGNESTLVHGVDASDPYNGEDGPGDAPEAVPDPTFDPDGDGIPDPDSDGDGIPDDEDNVPCLAVFMRIWNQNVSSASIEFNDVEVVSSNAFPTTEVIETWLNVQLGANSIALGGKLAGSPDDLLHFYIADTATPPTVYLEETVVREQGRPDDYDLSFVVDADCG